MQDTYLKPVKNATGELFCNFSTIECTKFLHTVEQTPIKRNRFYSEENKFVPKIIMNYFDDIEKPTKKLNTSKTRKFTSNLNIVV